MSDGGARLPVAQRSPHGLRRAGAVVALGLAVILVELTVAGAVADPRLWWLVPLLAGAAGLAVVFAFPQASTALLLVLAASIFHSSFFTGSLGPVAIHVQEVLLAALLLVAVVAPRRHSWGGAAGAALAAFLAIVVVCGWLGVRAGRVSGSDAFNWARPLAFYASFWIVLRLFPDARSLRRLLFAGLACGALTGVLALALQVVPSFSAMFEGAGGQRVYSQATQAGLGDLQRVRQPGLALSYVLFYWAIVAALTARGTTRAVVSVLVALSTLNIVLSFNRNMWLGLIFGFALLLALSGVRVRQRLLAAAALGLASAALMFTVVGSSSRAEQLEPIVERAASVLTPQQIGEESSLRDRGRETAQAWRTVTAHPLTGVGPGADFGVRFNHQEAAGVWVNTVQRFLHDQWIWLMLIGGIPAFLAFVTFLGTVLARAWRPRTRTLSRTALGVGVAMVMLSAIVMPYLGVQEFCLAIGVVAGVILRASELEGGPAGQGGTESVL